MFSTSLSLLFVPIFAVLLFVDAGHDRNHPTDSTDDHNLGPLPPRPGETGSRVPPNWQWQPVLVDDLAHPNPHIQDQAARTFQRNTLYSILSNQETQARNEYEAKEQDHIRHKQDQYNQNMKEEWKKDRMNSLPSKCTLS